MINFLLLIAYSDREREFTFAKNNTNVGYQIVRVEKYIPPPPRCNHRQRFGHHYAKCRIQTPSRSSSGGSRTFTECQQEYKIQLNVSVAPMIT